MTDKEFIEAIYELAFGHDAINRNFGHAEVIEQIEEFNEDSLKWDSIPDDDKKEWEDAFYHYEPTDDEVKSSFGTKWHDGL
jgi:heat shock protein HspQ